MKIYFRNNMKAEKFNYLWRTNVSQEEIDAIPGIETNYSLQMELSKKHNGYRPSVKSSNTSIQEFIDKGGIKALKGE